MKSCYFAFFSYKFFFPSRYFKVLIQEMSAKVDQGFLNAIIQLFSSDDVVSRAEEVFFNLQEYSIKSY